MKSFSAVYPPFKVVRRKDLVIVENKFVKWTHDLSRGGELAAAIVKNGSNSNILALIYFNLLKNSLQLTIILVYHMDFYFHQ